MIPKPHIAKWQQYAPWKEFAQIEQDLIISRALVEIFSDDFLRENLAFRGGTALHKLYLNPSARYSEDIDLVQIKPGPITGKRPPSRKEFLLNIKEKENSADFNGDMEGLLRPEIKYNQSLAFNWLKTELMEKI